MSFDATQFTVWGIPPYIFFVGIGTLFAFLVFNCFLLYERVDIGLGNKAVVLSIPFLLIGAKLFGIIASIYKDIKNNIPISFDTFFYSGIVFYGGLIFFVLAFLLFVKKYPKEKKIKIVNSLACAIPVFHIFGRIGCFTSGCCYGVTTDSLCSIYYTTWINGISSSAFRVPVQLIESVANLVIFIMLIVIMISKKHKGNLMLIYIFLYSIIRFLDEFLRDTDPDFILGSLSAAQIISLFLFLTVFVIILKERKNKCLTKTNG